MTTAGAPLVSVVTISRDDPAGLRATLASTRAQRHPRIEHLVIDGGSGPEVERLLRDAAPDHWQSRPDAGRYDAMNQGIARASGDVLWFMHSSDTFADPDAVGSAVAALAAGAAVRDGWVRDGWGYGAARIVGDDPRAGTVWSSAPFDPRGFALGVRPIPHQAAFFGADLVARLGGYSTGFGLAADHLFMLAASGLASPVVLDRVVCDFDAGGAGSVRPQHEHFDDVRRAWDELGRYPVAGRSTSRAWSRAVEWTARAKQVARGRR